MSDLWTLGAAELARRIHGRDVSSRDVVDAHLARIEEINPRLNAITLVLADSARAAADEIDAAIEAGTEIGPLGGVPFTIKENIDFGGTATTHGLEMLAGAVVPHDEAFVAELRRAGAIPIGRTNLPDLASRWHTDNALHGATLNPWSASHTPGGSSGGEAAALASGMTPLGLGNDIAGSLRWPSQCCGTVALKPSLGRITFAGHRQNDLPIAFAPQLLAVHGPMARRVEDLRLALHHMCGDDNGDPWFAPVSLTGAPLPRRVTVARDPGGHGVAPEVGAAVDRAAAVLADAGYELEERDVPALDRASNLYFQLMSSFSQATKEPAAGPEVLSEDFRKFWEALAAPFVRAGGEKAIDIMAERRGIALEWAQLFERTPLVLMPVATQPAFPVGVDLDTTWLEPWLTAVRAIIVVNLLGLPSVAFPTHEENGLPHGVQIVGPRFREDLCLDAAEEAERRLGSMTPIDPR